MVKVTSDNTTKKVKVFDVARPGTSDPDTGSRPMIIGHKSMASDPLLRLPDTQVEKTGASKESSNMTRPKTGRSRPDLKVPPKNTTVPERTPVVMDDVNVDASFNAHQNKDIIQQTEDNFKELVDSKKYNVIIHEANGFNVKVFLFTVIVVVSVWFILFVILVDLDIVDFGFDLPFDVL